MNFAVKPWTTRPGDVRAVSHVLSYGIPAIIFFQHHTLLVGFDSRELLADLFTTLTDGRDFAEIFGPRMGFLYSTVLANRWYMRVVRHLIEGEPASRSFVNRNMIACMLRFLVAEKLHTLEVSGAFSWRGRRGR
jgi:hypothetical protein